MVSLRDFWRRHRRKVFVTVGVLGGGYTLYKLYGAHRQRLLNLEREFKAERETDELIKAQQQAHFDTIQRIADSTTLPHAINYLRSRMSEELDLSHLTERLMLGKGQPNNLTPSEKLELWENLKILSFTKMVSSLWTITILNLYIRVQVNILGRHLYIDTARGLGSFHPQDEADSIERQDQQDFLATADYLANHGTAILIPNMRTAATEVLKGQAVGECPNPIQCPHFIGLLDISRKHLRDPFNTLVLHETITQILDTFMSLGGPHHWVNYLMPDNAVPSKQLTTMSSDYTALPQGPSKLEQLMIETQAVLSSVEFGSVFEISLQSVVETVIDDIRVHTQCQLPSGIALAKLLPRVASTSSLLLEEPSSNQFIQIVRSLPEVELFCSLLYANMPVVP